jgi:hypothetical protein
MAISPPPGHSLAGPAAKGVGTGIASDILLRARCVLCVLRGAVRCDWADGPGGHGTAHTHHGAGKIVALTDNLIRATVVGSNCWMVLVPEAVALKACLVEDPQDRHSKL